MPGFTCFMWLVWRTQSTLKLLNQVHPCSGVNKRTCSNQCTLMNTVCMGLHCYTSQLSVVIPILIWTFCVFEI